MEVLGKSWRSTGMRSGLEDLRERDGSGMHNTGVAGLYYWDDAQWSFVFWVLRTLSVQKNWVACKMRGLQGTRELVSSL